MSGMDRLTEETSAHRAVLDWIKEDAPIGIKMQMTPDLANKLSDRIAHRRASQAAPAPSDEPKPMAQFGHGTLVVDTGHHYGTPAVFIGPSQRAGPVSGLVPDDEKMPRDRLIEGEFFFTFPTDEQAERVADALVNAPAPSDGLREALSDMIALFSADGCLLKGTHLNATLGRARTALSAPPAHEGEPRHD